MRRNTIDATSGFKLDVKFGLLVPKNVYTRGNWALKLHFNGVFAVFVILALRMRRNTNNSTSGFKKDLKFGLLVPKYIYTRGNWA